MQWCIKKLTIISVSKSLTFKLLVYPQFSSVAIGNGLLKCQHKR